MKQPMIPYRDDRDALRQRITELTAELQRAEGERRATKILEAELAEARRQLDRLLPRRAEMPLWSWGGFLLGPLYYLMAGMAKEALQVAILWGAMCALYTWIPILGGSLLLLLHLYCGGRFFVHKRRWLDSRKRCAHCAEIIQAAATVCRYCGHSAVPALKP